MEKVYGRYVKMAAGLARNTPGYIWRRELGMVRMSWVIKEWLWRYVRKVYGMEEGRWPKVCLREEVRNILNNRPTDWGKKVYKSAREMGIVRVFEEMWNGAEAGEIRRITEEGLRRLKKKYEEEDDARIQLSTYNPLYEEICAEGSGNKYWEMRGRTGREKEIWCRIRCENVGKDGKKGWADENCRMCRREVESFTHILSCEKLAGNLKRETLVETIREKIGGGAEEEKSERLKVLLRGECDRDICEYVESVQAILAGEGCDTIGREACCDERVSEEYVGTK